MCGDFFLSYSVWTTQFSWLSVGCLNIYEFWQLSQCFQKIWRKKINMIIARMMKKILHSTGFGPNDQVGFFLIKFCFVAVWIPQQSYTCFRIWSPVSYKSFDTNSTRRKKRNEWLYFFGWVYNFSSLQSSEWIVTNRVPEVRFSSFQNQLKS